MDMAGKRVVRILVAVVMAGLLLGVLATPLIAESQQTWRLLHDEYSGTPADDSMDHYRDLVMSKTGDTIGSPYSMNLPSGQVVWWYTEYPAEVAVSFGTDVDWIVDLWHEAASDEQIKVELFSIGESGTYDQIAASDWIAATGSVTQVTLAGIEGKEQVVPLNSRIGLRVSWSGTEDAFTLYYYRVDADKLSRLISPSSDPGFPIPELPGMALFSIGLLLIGTLVLVSRKRQCSLTG